MQNYGTYKIYGDFGYMTNFIYNDLDSAICDFCGTKNKIYFNNKGLIYISKNCLNDIKYEKKDEIIDMNNITKCFKHNKVIIYT